VHRASIIPSAVHVARFSNSQSQRSKRRGRMRGDAFEDRRKPHTQTSANEVKGIKRMRIFTENMTPIRFISPSPLSQLAPFFLAVNARH